MGLTTSDIAAEDESGNWYIEGGNSVLMEQYTATWCDVCATIDPWIADFADKRGSRLIRIALHDPIADPLGSAISSERLSIHPESMELAPSFWFDSSNEIKGTVDSVDLDRALLNSEGLRDSDSRITIMGIESSDRKSVNLEINLSNVENFSDTHVSIFLVAQVSLEKSLATNGITTHEDVSVGYVNMKIDENLSVGELTSDTIFNYGFNNISMIKNNKSAKINLHFLIENEDFQELSIVVAHEKVLDDQRSTLGAVSLDLHNNENTQGFSLFWPMFTIALLSSMIFLKDQFL